jgi:hypothetical protein
VHPEKALFSILVTVLGIVNVPFIPVILKALLLIFVTLLGIVNSPIANEPTAFDVSPKTPPVPFIKTLALPKFVASEKFVLPLSMVISARLKHIVKAKYPISVTRPKSMEVIDAQYINALFPIVPLPNFNLLICEPSPNA